MDTRKGSSTSQTKPRIKTQVKDRVDLERVLDLAQFEIDHDPYRGIGNPDVLSPWFGCRYSEEFLGVVSQVVKCSCPSLVRWSRKTDALRRKRKRKHLEDYGRLGRRRDDLSFQTPCDYNPFCLASLGGVMDDFLEDVALQNIQADGTDDSHDVVEVSADGAPIIDVEMQPQHNQNERKNVSKMNESATPSVNRSSQSAANLEGAFPPSKAFLDEVSFSSDELDHTKDNSVYSKLTREQLLEIRTEIEVDRKSICQYVETRILAHVEQHCSPDRYCDQIQALHENLLFRNPLKPTELRLDKVKLALPPGIKNLGATCYLNTQLQCLARNTVFLDGIFAWRPSQSESRMDSVLSTLQQLLARLTFGSESTVTTEAFSTALGLQTDEMQDPNEFARLLFQKMHEAFQEMSNRSESGELSNLLPSVFEGIMVYETKCLHCESVKKRSEKFMDINLPIVRSQQAASKGDNGQLKLQDAFAARKKDETSLQYCLESYMRSEQLTGDNQYWCAECQKKHDAIRQVFFQELPPVLNVQLNRYVYDRVKQTKKKITDKVTLPSKLKMRMRTGQEPRIFVLCSVMKHLGNSAYRGHYVAEAMDWQTGTWYEFNDERVSILESGPSSCIDERCPKGKRVKGSEDAYNMYYVHESYLGQSAMHSLSAEQRRADDAVVKQLISERNGRYEMIAEMCRSDGKASERETRRKRGLLSLLRNTFHLTPRVQYASSDQGAILKDSVWVDGALLRSLFACSPDPVLDIMNRLKKKDDLICEHNKGMYPSIAHQGKLLPKAFAEGLLLLLRTEESFFKIADPTYTHQALFEPLDIFCDHCAEQYRVCLKGKLSKLSAVVALYDNLDPKRENNEDEDLNEDEYVYALSRRFIAAFRKSILLLLKKVQSLFINCGGLDTVEELDGFPSGLNEVDNLVNSAIVCENGKCCPSNKKSVRYVTKAVWKSILSYFPGAISLGKLRSQKAKWVRCQECEGTNRDRDSLEDWASMVTSGICLRNIAGRQKSWLTMFQDSEDHFVVHRKDIVKLQDACRLVERNPRMEIPLIKKQLRDLMFGRNVKNSEVCNLESVVQAWQPLMLLCTLHSLALNPIIFSRAICEKVDFPFSLWSFSDGVMVMPSREYRLYVLVILTLYDLLHPDGFISTGVPDLGHPFIESTMKALTAYHPRVRPVVDDSKVQKESVDSYSSVRCLVGDNAIDIQLSPGFCACQHCNSECVESLKTSKLFESGAKTIDLKDESVFSRLSSQNVIVGDDEVRIIEVAPPLSHRADEVSVRILEVDHDANLQELAHDLMQTSSMSGESTVRRSGRKRKQRFALGPIKSDSMLLLRFDHNMAALRLHILEKDPHFKVDQSLALMIRTGAKAKGVVGNSARQLTAADSEDGQDPGATSSSQALSGDEAKQIQIFNIPFEMNEKSIRTLVADHIAAGKLIPSDFTVFNDLIFIRRDPPALLKSRRLKRAEEEYRSAALMDSLLQVANLTDEHTEKQGEVTKTFRPIERGFTGTFLNTSLRPPEDNDDTTTPEIYGDEEKDLHSSWKPPVNTMNEPSKKGGCPWEGKATDSSIDLCATQAIEPVSSKNGCNNSSIQSVLLDELKKAVEENGTGNADEAAILNAVSWSINQNPASAGIRDLTDAAYAKYLEAAIC